MKNWRDHCDFISPWASRIAMHQDARTAQLMLNAGAESSMIKRVAAGDLCDQ
jgi:hypothetical protein